jgi:hypothetical protein
MRLIYCCDPLEPKQPEPDFVAEVEVCKSLGCKRGLIDFEALTIENDVERAVRRIKATDQTTQAVYRGWMMTAEQYGDLYRALEIGGLRLINTPAQYRHCHHLPDSYPTIEPYTPATAWVPVDEQFTLGSIHEVLRQFGDQPVVVKDYVKSQKHYWDEACFIPRASDAAGAERVVARFLELQEDSLTGGLVFREYIELEPLGSHEKSGMPLTKEFRIFFLDAQPVLISEYWDQGRYGDLQPPLERFLDVAAKVQSRFFTMDVAKRRDDDWIIIELGDGQVAGLPERSDPGILYRALLPS